MTRFPIVGFAVLLFSGSSFAQALLTPTTHDPVTQGPQATLVAPAPVVETPVPAPATAVARPPDPVRQAAASAPDGIMIPEANDPGNAFGVYAPPARIYAPPARAFAAPEQARRTKQAPVARDLEYVEEPSRRKVARVDARSRKRVAGVALPYVAPRRVSSGCSSLACSQFVLMGVAY